MVGIKERKSTEQIYGVNHPQDGRHIITVSSKGNMHVLGPIDSKSLADALRKKAEYRKNEENAGIISIPPAIKKNDCEVPLVRTYQLVPKKQAERIIAYAINSGIPLKKTPKKD